MHTAQHIVRNCLTGELAQDRTIILVTHHVSLCLPAAEYLVELSRGTILRQGTVQELRESGVLGQLVADEDDQDFFVPLTRAHTPKNEADLSFRLSNHAGTKGKLIEAEARAEGRVSWRTYMTYIRAAGFSSWILTVLLMLLIRAVNVGNQVIPSVSRLTALLTNHFHADIRSEVGRSI